MSCFTPTVSEIRTCPECGPSAGAKVTADRTYQECIECKRILVNHGKKVPIKFTPTIQKVPQELEDCFPGVQFVKEAIPGVQYRDVSGNIYGCIDGEWKKMPQRKKRVDEVKVQYCTIC